MKDLASLYLAHGVLAVAQEDITQYSKDACTDLLEWAAEYKMWDLFHHVAPYSNKGRLEGFALRQCLGHGYAEGVTLLLPHTVFVPERNFRDRLLTQNIHNNSVDVVRALLTPVCAVCHSYECAHDKHIFGGGLTQHHYPLLRAKAADKTYDMFKTLVQACNISDLTNFWNSHNNTVELDMLERVEEDLAVEQSRRISSELGPNKILHKRKI